MPRPNDSFHFVEEALKKHPGKNKTQIAKILTELYPGFFPDVEAARSAVRYATGTSGKKKRMAAVNIIEYSLPEPETSNTAPFKLPVTDLVVLSDIHIPYHDVKAVRAAVEYCKGHQAVLLNGDIMDMYGVSRFEKNPKKRDLAQELRDCRNFFFWLRQELPDAIIYFKKGNHEDRWQAYLSKINPAMLDIEDFHLPVIMRFGELKIIEIDTRGPVQAGRLNIWHGHELGMNSGGVNPARSIALKTKTHGMVAHFHRPSSHRTPEYGAGTKQTFSIGCLCDLNPEYMPVNEWSHGFAHVRVTGKDYHVTLLNIENGVIY